MLDESLETAVPVRLDHRLDRGERTDASPQSFRQSRALDGVRALAILLVLSFHFAEYSSLVRYFRAGYIGVDVFFVLSGFLITTLLIRERMANGAISIPAFYARRALRLFPALIASIILAVVLASTFAPPGMERATFEGLPWVVFYASDFAKLGHLGLLGGTWSLAIEEQFYLVWPWVLLMFLAICRGKRRLGIMALTLALLAVLDMLWSAHLGDIRAYFTLDGHAMGLLAGAALALAWNGSTKWRFGSAAKRLFQSTAVVAVLGLLLVPVLVRNQPLALTLATVLTVLLIPALLGAPSGPMHSLFSSRPAVWIGKRSYGLYLYNLIVLYTFMTYNAGHMKLMHAACFVVTFAIAALSYKYVEQPFLRRKERIRARSLSAGVGDVLLPAELG
jgi:peptidoglycan/LPS O-acetylase OafA/YrhL